MRLTLDLIRNGGTSEIRRRDKVIRIFPSKDLAYQLGGALLMEKHEEWSTSRRYLKTDEFYDWLDNRGAIPPL